MRRVIPTLQICNIEESGFSEQNQEQLTAEDVQLKTIIDASGVSHICSARMTTFAPTRSSIGLTVGVLKLEVRVYIVRQYHASAAAVLMLYLFTSPQLPSLHCLTCISPSG